jgi:hypothetical protein
VQHLQGTVGIVEQEHMAWCLVLGDSADLLAFMLGHSAAPWSNLTPCPQPHTRTSAVARLTSKLFRCRAPQAAKAKARSIDQYTPLCAHRTICRFPSQTATQTTRRTLADKFQVTPLTCLFSC